MLLNQCLAISLSPIAEATTRNKQRSHEHDDEHEEIEADHLAHSQQAAPHSNINPISAIKIFKQIIAKNLPFESHEIGPCDSQKSPLSEALQRVEFAGFVVPSWLLLSGTFDDLHCIKTSWTNGELESPQSFRIETIGEFCSFLR